uniref:Uncharacterized protein n=1 Tax=Desertifilum tharense IPPAS B-1220 TaxID=1781255 RepID=A0ACD5GS58_9CYAN
MLRWWQSIACKISSPLSAIADVLGAATVAEAYHIQALIREGNSDRLDLKLVNSGTIDRYQFLWGEKTLRYLGITIATQLSRRMPCQNYRQGA